MLQLWAPDDTPAQIIAFIIRDFHPVLDVVGTFIGVIDYLPW